MATVARRSDYSLESQLYSQTYEFDFHQAVRILEALAPNSIPFGEGSQPQKEAMQIQARVTLSVSSSDIYSLKPQRNPNKPPILTINFLGIAGIQGPLPTVYTEILVERLRKKDTAFRDFLDIFNHRLVAMWHRVHKKVIVGLDQVPPTQSPIGKSLFDLLGLGDPHLRDLLEVPDRSLLSYAPLFWQRTRSSAGLRQLLQGYFKNTVHIKELQGVWRTAPASDWSLLGIQFNRLGQDMVLGNRSWDQGGGIGITLSEISWQEYLTHLPGGQGHRKLISLVRFYCGLNTGVIVSAKITASQIPPAILGKSALGQTSWLTRGKGKGFAKNPLRNIAIIKV